MQFLEVREGLLHMLKTEHKNATDGVATCILEVYRIEKRLAHARLERDVAIECEKFYRRAMEVLPKMMQAPEDNGQGARIEI